MEDDAFIKAITESRTVRWIVGAGILSLCRLAVLKFGLPEIPPDIQAEATVVAIAALEVIGLGALSVAAWFRVQARSVISGWFK